MGAALGLRGPREGYGAGGDGFQAKGEGPCAPPLQLQSGSGTPRRASGTELPGVYATCPTRPPDTVRGTAESPAGRKRGELECRARERVP